MTHTHAHTSQTRQQATDTSPAVSKVAIGILCSAMRHCCFLTRCVTRCVRACGKGSDECDTNSDAGRNTNNKNKQRNPVHEGGTTKKESYCYVSFWFEFCLGVKATTTNPEREEGEGVHSAWR